MATRMQQRRGTAAQWLSTNNGNGPVLNIGEIGYESDTNKFKIGDGVSHWIDLNYFADAVELGGSIDDYIPLTQKGVANGVATLNSSGVIPSEQIPSLVGLDTEITTAVNNAVNALVDGAPAALNTLNELAAAVNDNENFAAEIILEMNTKQDIVTGVSDVEIGYLNGVHSAIQTQIDDIAADVTSLETNKADASTLAENVIDTMAGALTEGTDIVITHNDNANTITIAAGPGLATNAELADAVSNHSNDTTNIHGITDTAELATKTFAANLLVNATKTNIQITGDKDGISIVAENGVADSTTDNLSEGSTNKYYTDARVETKLDASTGTGLDWNNTSKTLYVDETTVQFRVADVSDTEIGYLNGVTSAIQTQLNDKQPKVSGVSDTEIGYLDGVTSAIQTQIDSKLASSTASSTYAPIANPTFTGTVAGVTKDHVGLGNVDNTSDANKPVSTATQTALDAKLNLSGGTLTGALTLSADPTSDLHAATKSYVDAATAGLNVHASVKAATTANVNLTNAVDNNKTLDGYTLSTGDRILIKNQSTAADNGIYIVASNGAPTRAADYNQVGEIDAGDFIFVESGTVNGKTGWIQTNAITTLGTDEIAFTQFSGAGTYTAGSALTLTGSTFSIADGAITSAKIADGAIVDADVNASAAIAQSKISGLTSDLAAKAPLASPTFTGTVTIPNGAALGTPASATLTNATGLPVSTGVSGLGTGVATFLTTPSSANLATAVTDETGSGALVFGTSPVIATPTLTLSTTTSTTNGRIAWDGTNDKIIVGDGSLAIEFAPSTALINAQTASYTLVAADKDKMVELNVGSANTLTVPTNASVPLPVGSKVDIIQTGTGQVTITPASGVTINGTPGLKTRAQWSAVTLVKRATDTWIAFGDLTA